MISIDDFLKLILVLSVSFAIAGIALQIMRLISKFTTILEDVRSPLKNVSTLSDYLLEDYNEIRKYIKSIGSILEGVDKFLGGIGFLKFFKRSSGSKE